MAKEKCNYVIGSNTFEYLSNLLLILGLFAINQTFGEIEFKARKIDEKY